MDWLEEKVQEELKLKSRSPPTWEFPRLRRGVSKKLKEHREEFFPPNARVRANGWWGVRHIHRCNGSAERKFHRLRHNCPRITGDVGRKGQVQREGPGMLMVRERKDSGYLRVVYGSLFHFGDRFAQVSPEALVEARLVLTRKRGSPSRRKACGQR
jgi:hypothetical protein